MNLQQKGRKLCFALDLTAIVLGVLFAVGLCLFSMLHFRFTVQGDGTIAGVFGALAGSIAIAVVIVIFILFALVLVGLSVFWLIAAIRFFRVGTNESNVRGRMVCIVFWYITQILAAVLSVALTASLLKDPVAWSVFVPALLFFLASAASLIARVFLLVKGKEPEREQAALPKEDGQGE